MREVESISFSGIPKTFFPFESRVWAFYPVKIIMREKNIRKNKNTSLFPVFEDKGEISAVTSFYDLHFPKVKLY